MLEQQANDILLMGEHARIIAMSAIVVFAYLADFLCCRFRGIAASGCLLL